MVKTKLPNKVISEVNEYKKLLEADNLPILTIIPFSIKMEELVSFIFFTGLTILTLVKTIFILLPLIHSTE